MLSLQRVENGWVINHKVDDEYRLYLWYGQILFYIWF